MQQNVKNKTETLMGFDDKIGKKENNSPIHLIIFWEIVNSLKFWACFRKKLVWEWEEGKLEVKYKENN